MLASKILPRTMCYRTVFVGLHSMSRILGHRKEKYMVSCVHYSQVRGKKNVSFDSLFESHSSVQVASPATTISASKRATNLSSEDISRVLTEFIRKPQVRNLAIERGLNVKQLRSAFVQFRSFCLNQKKIPVELDIILNDIVMGARHPDDLFRQFMEFASKMYPFIQCKNELSQISDLRDPSAWYPNARGMGRKIIYHAGPTNSGKTYHALQKFMKAKTSVYCGPLKMLVHEVFQKMTEQGVDCDLATGDERVYCKPNNEPSDRISCTVEMTPLGTTFDVAVIDEIQMLQDGQRGWAWTRALLGVAAKEVHVCGEAGAIPLVQNLLATAGEEVEVVDYKRLTGLKIESGALNTLSNARPGDCFVCFSKKDLYKVTKKLENLNHRVAIIYGSLPPGTKLAQCNKFNNKDDPCQIMVATDAIGMGLNLNIRRIIFSSVRKIDNSPDGKKSYVPLSVSQALQIAGRAGRFGTDYEEGLVTTLYEKDLKLLKSLLTTKPPPVQKAGLSPTSEQIELFAYHLPDSSLRSIIEIFIELCQMDNSLYFMCNTESFLYLTEKMDSIALPLRLRYLLCCAPVNINDNFVVSMLIKMATRCGENKVMTDVWLASHISWPPPIPSNMAEMSELESRHDVLDLYTWLSLRFTDLFQGAGEVKKMKAVLDDTILQGLVKFSGQGFPEAATESDVEEVEGGLEKVLLQTGTLSQEVLDRLKHEWKEEAVKTWKKKPE